jgi:hypothetical protein
MFWLTLRKLKSLMAENGWSFMQQRLFNSPFTPGRSIGKESSRILPIRAIVPGPRAWATAFLTTGRPLAVLREYLTLRGGRN